MNIARASKLAVVTALLAALPVPARAQSRDIHTYLLFALKELRTKGPTIRSGHIGVNQATGRLYISPHGQLVAPQSQVVADTVRGSLSSVCSALYSNLALQTMGGCGPASRLALPILADPAAVLGFPSPFPACSADASRGKVVLGGATLTLPPDPAGYGDIRILGSGTLVLTGGDYRFCSLRASRHANIFVQQPATVHVSGTVNLANNVFLGPDPSILPVISPRDIHLFVNGTMVHFSGQSDVHAALCAPRALLRLTHGAHLNGMFVADTIHTERITGELPPTTLTTTTSTSTTTSTTSKSTTSTSTSTIRLSSTTTTTMPTDCKSLCGNGHIDAQCNEDCDKQDFGHTACPGSSAAGAMLVCNEDCTIDFDGCPNALKCGDGVKQSFEQCDPVALTSGCPAGKVCGAAGTPVGCLCVPPEICGNCIDDDGNGDTDFEDAACCSQAKTFRMSVSRARLRPRGAVSTLRLRTTLAQAGLSRINPQKQDVFVQIRPSRGEDLLCARIPAQKFMRMRRVFAFWDKKHEVTSAKGINDAKVMIRRNGTVRFRALGRRAQLRTPAHGPLQLTVAFHDAAGDDANNLCSTETPAFRTGRQGRLIAP
jgi:hypothetical protein